MSVSTSVATESGEFNNPQAINRQGIHRKPSPPAPTILPLLYEASVLPAASPEALEAVV